MVHITCKTSKKFLQNIEEPNYPNTPTEQKLTPYIFKI